MGVREALLALVAEQPRHGYGLKLEFERRTEGLWPLNVGQVYQALRRLERDGQVVRLLRRPDGSVRYVATTPGEQAARRWWTTGVEQPVGMHDDVAAKLLLAASAPEVDVSAVLHVQRQVTAHRLHELARCTRAAVEHGQHGRALVCERLLAEAEAEAQWLERAVAATAAGRVHGGSGTPAAERPGA